MRDSVPLQERHVTLASWLVIRNIGPQLHDGLQHYSCQIPRSGTDLILDPAFTFYDSWANPTIVESEEKVRMHRFGS
jgi:hypothetical protein